MSTKLQAAAEATENAQEEKEVDLLMFILGHTGVMMTRR